MSWRERLPAARGKLILDAPLAPLTWLRVGGPADVLFLPEDEADLAQFLGALDPGVPVTPLGVGSNLLVRDGGLEGVAVRLGRGFGAVQARSGARIRAGAAVLDAQLARAAATAGIAGLEFYSGVPGTVGGAVTMNAGCYGAETRDVLTHAFALTRSGQAVCYDGRGMNFSYRRSAPWTDEPLIFTSAMFIGRPDRPDAIAERMGEITARREKTQPIREKTGGSTFKNPEGHSAWRLIDGAGWRGRPRGGARFSELHANFLINDGEAAADDLEGLGEAVRADVLAKTGVQLEWEIKRIGRQG